MSTQSTTTLTQEDSEILNGILSSAVADYFYADSTDYRAMLRREWEKVTHAEREHTAREDRLYRDLVRS